ncbi:MAG: hypothetical protein JNM68_06290 [Dinghuibacter sp.]|nr:hypothetical protein [Dinghuibacter sp.]
MKKTTKKLSLKKITIKVLDAGTTRNLEGGTSSRNSFKPGTFACCQNN